MDLQPGVGRSWKVYLINHADITMMRSSTNNFLCVLCLTLLMPLVVRAGAQQPTVNLAFTKAPVTQVLEEIGRQTAMSVVYNVEDVAHLPAVDFKAKNEALDKVLDRLLKGTGLEYAVANKHIILSKKAAKDSLMVAVTGTVRDAVGLPLVGVSVVQKGSRNAAITSMDGAFSLDVPVGSVLEISYMGFISQHVEVSRAAHLNLVLQEDMQHLEEVVVTALGIKRSEKALAYNVQKVDGGELTAIKDANFVNSLNGKVAGVNIQRSASGVGGSTRVVMRGNKSIAGDNNVLYVVDGVPVGNQANRSGDGSAFDSQASGEGIGNFNPDDIESISVLTGPSAAALYGASAANGVILISTKKGSEGKARVNVASSVEFSSPFVLPRFQNTYGNVDGSYFSWGERLETPSTFHPAQFYQRGAMFSNAFNLSVGSSRNQTYVSGATLNSEGVVENNKYNRYNVTFRNTSKLLDEKLTLDFSASYVREYYNNMISSGVYFNPVVGVYLYPRGLDFAGERFFERYDRELGYNVQHWGPGSMGVEAQNPWWIAYRNVRPQTKDRYMFYGNATYALTSWLNVAARFRLDNTYTEREDKRYASTASTFAGTHGRYAYSNETFRQKYADLMLNMDKALGSQLRATVNAGASVEEYDTKGHGYGGDLLLVPNKFTYGNVNPAVASVSETGGDSRKANLAVFASAALAWNSALYLTLTGRADKPSQLVNSQNEWIFYPSVGLSAIVTEFLNPAFRQRLEPVLGFLKVRTSVTEVGSPISFTGLTPGTVTHKLENGTVAPFEYYPLSDFKAERTRSYEVGLDSRWWHNTLSLGVTYYHSNTYNQLLKADLPGTSGYRYLYVQAGDVQNRGWEFSLGYDNAWGHFQWETHLTATTNKNILKKLPTNALNPVTGQPLDLSDIKIGRFRLREGGEIGALYADRRVERNSEGYVSYTPGQALATETTAPYQIGTVNPKWNLGWQHSFAYKGLHAGFLFTARIGGHVISKTQAYLDRFGVSEASALAREAGVMRMGQLEMLPQDYYTTIQDLDAFYVYSATNVRLQEAHLGYTLPDRWFGKVLRDVTLSVHGTNLWMIYNKAPFDPELTAATGTFGQGYDYFMLPSNRSCGFSLKFAF